jgi:hypothetical protein
VALREELNAVRVFPASHGVAMVIVAALMLLVIGYQWFSDASVVTRGLRDMLGMG